MINEITIKAFLTLARLGNFTAAGRELYLSQQAVSKQIAKMEQDLGCELFHRERGRLSMTGAGKIYYDAFSKIADIFENAHEEAKKLTGGWDQTLYVGVPEIMDLYPVIWGLNQSFQEQNPEVKIVFKSEPHWVLLNQLKTGDLDVVFTFSREVERLDWPDAVFIEQINEVLVVSSDHPKVQPDTTYMDFADQTVFYTPEPAEDDAEILHHMKELNFPADHLTPVDNIMTSCANVEHGQGVTFILDRCRVIQSDVFQKYPTNVFASLVLAFNPENRKNCAREYLKIARSLFEVN